MVIFSTREADKDIKIKVPEQVKKHECQHVESGACVKCRFPMTWRQFIIRS